jgi:hypothetical protein
MSLSRGIERGRFAVPPSCRTGFSADGLRQVADRQLTMYLRIDADVVLASIEDAPVSTSHEKTVAAATEPPVPLIVATLVFDAQGQLERYAGQARCSRTRATSSS